MQNLKQIAHALLLLNLILSETVGSGILHSAASFSKCLSLGRYSSDFVKLADCKMQCTKQQIDTPGIIDAMTNYVEIKFVSNGRCLSRFGRGGDGIRLIPWPSVSQANQKWKILGGDSYKAFQLQVLDGKLCLTAKGNYAVERACDVSDSNQFWIWDQDDQPIQVLESAANPNMCLRPTNSFETSTTTELSACDITDFGQLIRMGKNGDFKKIVSTLTGNCLQESPTLAGFNTCQLSGADTYQKWGVFSPNSIGYVVKGSGVYVGSCLAAVVGCSANPAVVMEQYDETYVKPSQYWLLKSVEVYLIKVYNPDPNIRNCVYAVNNNLNLLVTSCSRNKPEQQFRLVNWANGSGFLQVNRKCASTYSDSLNDGVRIIQNDCTNFPNQFWNFYTETNKQPFIRFQNKNSRKCWTLRGSDTYAHQEVCGSAEFGKFQRFVLEKYK